MELRLMEEALVGGQQQHGETMQGLFSVWSLGLAATLLVWWLWTHRYAQRDYIGPKTWPILGCFVEQIRNFDVVHDWLLGYFRRGILTFPVPMGSVNNTFTADPTNVEHILKNNFANYPKGEVLRDRFIDLMGLGIFNVDGDEWRHQRKVVTVEFASSKLRDYSIHTFRAGALKLAEVLAIASKRGQVMDMQDCFMRLTLDSICKVGFGVDIGCLAPSLPALPFANAFDEANRLVVRRYIDMFWKIKRVLNIGAEAVLKQKLHVINTFLYNVINTRRAELQSAATRNQDQAGVDILSRFMSNNEGGEAYSDQRLRDIVINFIIAGRDTTALTLSWFFYELCRNPHVVDNIVAELDTVVGEVLREEGMTTSDQILKYAELLTYQNVSKMQYLHGAITEALRLYPSVPLETKVAAGDDTFPDGSIIKEGEFVSYSSYAMGRLKCIWGPDVMDFKPERWLKNGVFQAQSPFKLTAFQAGPRICLGKDSAYLQMKMTAALLLKFFRFSRLPEEAPPKYVVMVVLFISNGLHLNVSQHEISKKNKE